MFGIDLLPVETLGVLASVVASLITLIPALGVTSSRRAGVAIATLFIAVIAQDGFAFESWRAFAQTLIQASVYSLVTYQMILKPIVLPSARAALKLD